MALQPAVMTVSNVYDEHLKLVTVAGYFVYVGYIYKLSNQFIISVAHASRQSL